MATEESQLDAFQTPGSMLRAARESRGLSAREVSERLYWMPGYADIIERDDYQALRRPTFARGYVMAYGKLMGLDEKRLLAAMDQMEAPAAPERRRRRRPPQLHRTGAGVVWGLVILGLLVAALWWHGRNVEDPAAGIRAERSTPGLAPGAPAQGVTSMAGE